MKFANSITELSNTNSNFLDPTSFIEISRKENDQTFKSYKSTLQELDNAIIEKFSLYNNLNDIFNPNEHPGGTYFGNENTTFLQNPCIVYENVQTYTELKNENLVTKYAVDEYLKSTGICIPICTPDSQYVYYSADEQIWIADNTKKPKIISYQNDGIWTSESKVKFHYGNDKYYFTDEITTPKNIMLDVTGNIVLNDTYSNDWYELQKYFVGLTINGKVITMAFLKNILKLDDYTIAQFHFHCPLGKNTTFRIVTSASCRLFGMPEKDQYSRKLYDSLNAVNLSYYDYNRNV